MSKIHLDLLDEKRKKIFKNLSFFKPFGYLAGGTALTLQIYHRQKDFLKKEVLRYVKKIF